MTYEDGKVLGLGTRLGARFGVPDLWLVDADGCGNEAEKKEVARNLRL